jgi:hypothetical protein
VDTLLAFDFDMHVGGCCVPPLAPGMAPHWAVASPLVAAGGADAQHKAQRQHAAGGACAAELLRACGAARVASGTRHGTANGEEVLDCEFIVSGSWALRRARGTLNSAQPAPIQEPGDAAEMLCA